MAPSISLLSLATLAWPLLLSAQTSPDLARILDRFSISDDMRTIKYRMKTTTAIDEIRIITAGAAAPSPGSLALLAISGLVAWGRRRRLA